MATQTKSILSDEDMDSSLPVLDLLVNGHTVTYSIHLACRLSLADILAEAGKPLSVSEIVEKIPGEVNSNYLTRIIRLLCAFGVFQESLEEGVGKYNLTSLSQLLRKDVTGNINQNLTYIADPTCLKAWSVLEKCVRSKDVKTPFTLANGGDSEHWPHEAKPIESHLHTPDEACGDVHQHSHSHSHGNYEHEDSFGHESKLETLTLLRYFADGFKAMEEKKVHIADLGGHSGDTLALVKQSYPGLQCTSVDLPATIDSIKSKPEGVTLVSGNYFELNTLPKCDVILMKHIIHMYEERDKCEEILKNCNQCLPLNGKVIICENVVPKVGEIDVKSISCKRAFLGDINMLLFGAAAKTMEELLAIFETTGFKLVQFISTPDVMTQILVVEKVH